MATPTVGKKIGSFSVVTTKSIGARWLANHS